MSLKCPVCDKPMSFAERQGIEIDYCLNCGGVWLDRGELDKIITVTDGLIEEDETRTFNDAARYDKEFLKDIFNFEKEDEE